MPTKHTTQHVAHTTLPVGGINEKGQMKVVDKNGITRFISMKQPRVLSADGIPVKPQKA